MIEQRILITLLLMLPYSLFNHAKSPVGIQNAGNTCFMNAALQCLYHSTSLTEALRALPKGYYEDGTASSVYLKFLDIYRSHAEGGKNIGENIAKVNWCVNLINLIPFTEEEREAGYTPENRLGYTHDAGELLVKLLQHLLQDDVAPAYFDALPKYPFPLYPLPINQLTDLLVTIISETKQFIDRQTTTKLDTHVVSNPQYMLPISIVKPLPDGIEATKDTVKIFGDLASALDNTFNKKEFSPSEARNPFYKVKKMLKLPELLIINLDRYTYLDGARYKIYNRITFPVNNLNLERYLVNPHSQASDYDLYGIVMHHGEGAHYTAYVKVGNDWYNCDDFHVEKVAENVVIQLASTPHETEGVQTSLDIRNSGDWKREITPYLLFYKQRLGTTFNVKKANNIKVATLRSILESVYAHNYLPLPYLDKYLAAYKTNLTLLADGINEGLISTSYIVDVFSEWVDEQEKNERRNILKNLIISLQSLSARR